MLKSFVIPDAAQRLSGISNPGRSHGRRTGGYGVRALAFGRTRNDGAEFSTARYPPLSERLIRVTTASHRRFSPAG